VKAARPHSSSIRGWWPSASASSATRTTRPNGRPKSSNGNSRVRTRVPSRSQPGTSRASRALSASESGGVPGGYSWQCSSTSSVTAQPY
jgi:hypothetical protein